MAIDLSIFKDYDIRGTYPDQLNGDVVYHIGLAIVKKFNPKTVAICRDMRLSGDELFNGLSKAFTESGVDVFDAGLGGTEIAYFISGTRPYDMAIMISASHNPPQYNGLKIVLRGPIAVSGDSGLKEIASFINTPLVNTSGKNGTITPIDVFAQWKDKVLSFIEPNVLKPLKIVIDAGNGMAGKLVPMIFKDLPFTVIPLYFEPDGTFPNHTPNPLIESNNAALIELVKKEHADMGLTFDGDADRVFFVDDTGRFVSGSLVTALLARYILIRHPGEYVLYSAVCGRIVPKIITQYKGKFQRVRVGHSFMKNFMRKFKAIFAGEHSGHYYHRDFFNSESGVITALMMLTLLCHDSRPFSKIVDEVDVYPSSGEINFTVSDINGVIESIRKAYHDADTIDDLDGLSVWYKTFWFNIRASKTEPLLRINVEADNKEILNEQLDKLISIITTQGGVRQ